MGLDSKPVGGIAELPAVARGHERAPGGSGANLSFVAAAVAGVAALATTGGLAWHTKRRR